MASNPLRHTSSGIQIFSIYGARPLVFLRRHARCRQPLSGALGAFRKHVMYELFFTALKKHTGHHPGLVSENGVQFKGQDNLKRDYEDNEEEQLGVLPPPRIYRFQATGGARVPSQDCPTLRW